MPNFEMGTAHGRIIVDSSTIGRSISALQSLSKGLLIAGGIGAAAFGFAIKSAADFEQEVSRFKAVTGTPEKAMESMRQKALQLGRDSAYGAGEVMKSFVELGKSGATATEILQGMGDAVVYLAAAGELPLADASDILVNAMKQFHIEAKDATHISDLLAQAANASTSEVDDLANSLRYAGPVAAFAGISIEDTATTLAIFANAGIKGSAAGTAMRAMLLGMAATTPKAEKTLKKLGIITEDGTNQFYDMNGALKPLPEVFQLLGDHLKGLTPHEKTVALNAIFLRRGLVSAAIAATEGSNGFLKMRDSMAKSGSAQDVMKKKLDNLKGSFKVLMSSIETAAIVVGEQFLPVLKKITDAVKDGVNWFTKLSPETKKWITLVGGGLTAVLLFAGGLLWMGTKVLRAYRAFKELRGAIRLVTAALEEQSIAALTNPYLLIAVAVLIIVAAIVLLALNWDKVWKWISNAPWYVKVAALILLIINPILLMIVTLAYVASHWQEIWGWIKQAVSDASDWIVGAWDDIKKAFNDAVKFIVKAWHKIEGAGGDVIDWFKALPGVVEQALSDAADWLQHFPEHLAHLATDSLHWLTTTGVNMLMGLLSGLVKALPAITAWLLSLPAKIVTVFADAATWLVDDGANMLLGFLLGLYQAQADILFWILGTLIPSLSDWAADAITWLWQKGWDLLQGLWNGAIELLKTLIPWLAGLAASFVVAVGELILALPQAGRDLIQGLWNGAYEIVPQIIQWLLGLPEQFVTAVGDLGTKLVQAGIDFIMGFKKGIEKAADKVKNFIGDIFGGFVDAVGGFLHVGSPSKLMEEYGKWTMQGYLQGLQKTAPQIQDYMNEVAKMAADPMAALSATTDMTVTGVGAAAQPDAMSGMMAGILAAVRSTQAQRDGEQYGYFRDLIVQAPTPNPVDVGYEVARRNKVDARRMRR